MKQVTQVYRTGKLDVVDVPRPLVRPSSVLVRSLFSAISSGTEKTKVDTAKMSLLQKARSRPDLVKKVIEKVKKEGLKATYQMVDKKLSEPMPLGYSSVGVVEEIGEWVEGIRVGDIVACAGAGYANHAEYNVVPGRLVTRCAENVPPDQAAFTTIGSIALQGVRQAEPKLGERIVVLGMGLIGQITAQLLKANGCEVFAIDLDPWKLELARAANPRIPTALATDPSLLEKVSDWSQGRGADAVLLTASTSSDEPISQAGVLCRDKGRVVIVGAVGTAFPREPFYMKEIDIRIARSYGPGRYDPQYEELGIDYPLGFVRFTEQRNMETFVNLLGSRQIDLSSLITHRFSIESAQDAFALLSGTKPYLGIVLEYGKSSSTVSESYSVKGTDQVAAGSPMDVGFIGLGNYATSQLLPALSAIPEVRLRDLVTSSGMSAASKSKQFGFEKTSETPKQILSSPATGTVFVVTRHDTHGLYVKEALASGKNVFVEKPLCLNLEELEEIKKSYEVSSGLLCVGFNRRFSPLVQEVKSLFPLGASHISYRVNAGVLPKEHWLKIPEIGGGRILGEGCHFVDLVAYLGGAPIVSVFAQAIQTVAVSPSTVEDVHISLGLANGNVGTIIYSSLGSSKLPKEYIEVHGGGKSAVIHDFSSMEVSGGPLKKLGKQDKGQRKMIMEFMNSCQAKDRLKAPIPAEDIWNSTAATLAVIESIRTGAAVRL